MKNIIKILLISVVISGCANLKEINKTMSQLKNQNRNLEKQLIKSDALALELRKQIRDIEKIINENQKLNTRIAESGDMLRRIQTQIIKAKKIKAELNLLSNTKRLKSLSISDNNGFDRIKLFVDNEGVPRIRIYDENSNPSVSLFSYPINSRGKGAAGFAVVNSKEEPLVWLGNTPNKSRYLSFKSENGTAKGILIGSNFEKKLNFMALLDHNSKIRLINAYNYKRSTSFSVVSSANLKSSFEVSAFRDGRILRRMQDSNGRLRQANLIDGNNNLYQMHYDYLGKLKQALYIPLDESKFENYSYKKPGDVLWQWFSNIMTIRSLFRK